MIILNVFFGIAVGSGNPGCKAPIDSMVALTFLKSCNSLHFPDFFFIINMGEFHGDVDGAICPLSSCSCTSNSATFIFSSVRGHWSTQTGLSLFQVILSAWSAGEAVANSKNILFLLWEASSGV